LTHKNIDLKKVSKRNIFQHATISGQICPYCDNTWGWKKFNNLDEHVSKYHMLEMQSPVQTWYIILSSKNGTGHKSSSPLIL